MKKNIWIWIAAVLFAVLLWLQSIFLSEQEETIQIPLRIEKLPTDLIISDESDPEIGVILKTKGINILFFHNQKVEYVVQGNRFKKGSNSLHLSLKKLECSPRIREYISGFDSDVKLIEIDKIITERKPVIFTYKNRDEEQYFNEHPLNKSMAEVSLRGPSKKLARIEGIQTEKLSHYSFKNNEKLVKLIKPDKDVKLLKDEILVTYSHEALKIKTIPLVPVNYQEETGIKISPQRVTVKISDMQSLLNRVKKEDIHIELIIDEQSEYGSLKFDLPQGIKIEEYTPDRIRIIRR